MSNTREKSAETQSACDPRSRMVATSRLSELYEKIIDESHVGESENMNDTQGD